MHRYTFNSGNANDSIGTAHGVMVDPAPANHTFTAAGKLDMSGNDGGNPGNNAYLNLPNLIIQGAAQSGTSGALSLEWWFTVSEAAHLAAPRRFRRAQAHDAAERRGCRR